MALNVGELAGILRFEDHTEEGVRSALDAAERRFGQGGDAAARAFTDRVGAGVDGVDEDLARAGDRAGRRFGDSLSDWLNPVPNDFGAAGDDAGRRFGDQATDGLEGLADEFGEAGSDAGTEFGESAGSEAETKGGGKLSGWLGGLGAALGGVALLAGGAIGGAIATGISGALGRDQGEGLLQGQLGLTDEQAAAAGKAAANVYGNGFGENLGGVQEAVGAVWSTLGESIGPGEDALERATERALTLAQVMGVDVGAAVNTAGIAVKTGLAKDATEAFDLMTAASQRMPAEMRAELIPAIDEYGTFLASMGITGEEAFGLLANASQNGAFGIDKTGDALKELGIKATDMSASSVAAYEAAGLNAEEMSARFLAGGESARGALSDLVDGLQGIDDPVERANAAIALFGTPLEDLNVTQIPDFLSTLDSMGAGVEEVAGRTDKAAADMSDDAGSKFETFRRKARMAFNEFVGGKVLGPLERVADRVGPLWSGVTEAFRTDGISGAANRLGEVWDQAWPVIERKAGELFERGRQWIVANGPRYLAATGDLAERFWDWLQDAWPVFARRMAGLYGQVANWFAEVGVPAIGDWLKDAGPRFWQWLQDAYPSFVRTMAGLWAQIGEWLVSTGIPWIAVKGAELWAALFEWLWTEAVPALWRGLGSVLEGARAWLDDTAIPWLKMKGGEWFGKLLEAAGEQGLALLGWFQSLPGIIGDWITGTALPRLKTAASEWFGAMVSAAGEKGLELYVWATGLPGQLADALGGLASMLAGPFIDAFNAIARAWNSTVGAISFHAPDWVPGLGGKGFDVPDIPVIEGRARGGPIRRGTPYIVGEEGPELVVPDASGTVIPHGRTASMLAGIGPELQSMLSSLAARLDADLMTATTENTGLALLPAGWAPGGSVDIDYERLGAAVARHVAPEIEHRPYRIDLDGAAVYRSVARRARSDSRRRGTT